MSAVSSSTVDARGRPDRPSLLPLISVEGRNIAANENARLKLCLDGETDAVRSLVAEGVCGRSRRLSFDDVAGTVSIGTTEVDEEFVGPCIVGLA